MLRFEFYCLVAGIVGFVWFMVIVNNEGGRRK